MRHILVSEALYFLFPLPRLYFTIVPKACSSLTSRLYLNAIFPPWGFLWILCLKFRCLNPFLINQISLFCAYYCVRELIPTNLHNLHYLFYLSPLFRMQASRTQRFYELSSLPYPLHLEKCHTPTLITIC